MAMLDGNDGCSKATMGCLISVALIIVFLLLVLGGGMEIAFFAFAGMAVVAAVAYLIYQKVKGEPKESAQTEAAKDVSDVESQPTTEVAETPKAEKKEYVSLEKLQDMLANEKDDRKKVFIENCIKSYDILKDRHDNFVAIPKDLDSDEAKQALKECDAFREKMISNQLVIGDEMAPNADAYRELGALIDKNDCDEDWLIKECISGYHSSSFEEAPTIDRDTLFLFVGSGLNWVGSYCEVPYFCIGDEEYYIYPNFIVKINDRHESPCLDFEILPFDDMEVNFVKVRLKETLLWSDLVHDAKRVGSWYDEFGVKRPINEYGAIEIPKLNVTFMFSKASYAKKLAEAMNEFFSIKVSSEKMVRRLGSEELDTLIGLTTVKQEVNTLRNYIKIQQEREKNGLKPTQVSYHCVFTGNPGTGKTTVARIVAQIYKELGILKKGHLIETDRSGLVAEYVGQTAVKTNKIIDKALDGVLFIDEAYSLVNGDESDYGREAIATLLKRMEDNRDRLVVILAGYSDEMKTFIDSNPGLQSRFNRYIHFPDYSEDELFRIFCLRSEKSDYVITEEGKARLKELLAQSVANKDKNFGNARFVRNLFEKTVEHQANRLAKMDNLTQEMLSRIEKEDVGL